MSFPHTIIIQWIDFHVEANQRKFILTLNILRLWIIDIRKLC